MATGAGNSPQRPFAVNIPVNRRGTFTRRDRVDFYRFTLATRSSFDLLLTNQGRGANARVLLTNSSGTVSIPSNNPGRNPENINRTLEAGTYTVRVQGVVPRGARNTRYQLSMTATRDDAGDALGTARAITLPGAFNDFVSTTSDPNDYYRFSLTGLSNVALSLNGLAANTQLNLLNAAGGVVQSTSGTGTASLNAANLTAGTYYVQVSSLAGRTNYSLNASATLIPPTPDLVGNVLALAKQINLGFSTQSANASPEPIGGSNPLDPADYYTFTTPSIAGRLDLGTGSLAGATLDLRDANDQVITPTGSSSGIVSYNLVANTPYYVRVSQPVGGTLTNYNFTTNFTPADTIANDFAGADLNPITLGTGQAPTTLTEFAGGSENDLDIFRFNLSTTSFLGVGLAGLTEDLNVKLFDAANPANPLLTSDRTGIFNEAFQGRLAAGSYYLQIERGTPTSGSIYNLSLFANLVGSTPSITRNVNVTGDALANNLTNVNGVLYFSANDGTGEGLWKSLDGTLNNTTKIASFNGLGNFINVNGTLYFVGDDGTTGREIWKSDGTTVQRISDINAGAGSSDPSQLRAVGNTLYFEALPNPSNNTDFRLYRTDGNAVSEIVLPLLPDGINRAKANELTVAGADLYYTANGILYRVASAADFSSQPVAIDFGVNTPPSGVVPSDLVAVGNNLFLRANTTDVGTELRRVSAGVITTYDLASSFNSAGFTTDKSVAVSADNYAYYVATGDNIGGMEIWRSRLDGTQNERVTNINTNGDSNPTNLTVVGNRLYFAATDGTTADTKLYTMDLSSATPGTTLVKLENTSSGSTQYVNPQNLIGSAGTLYFVATNPTTGSELWKSDGTAGGTQSVLDVNPGVNSSFASDPSSRSLVDLVGKLYFVANDGTNGSEVWTL